MLAKVNQSPSLFINDGNVHLLQTGSSLYWMETFKANNSLMFNL